MKKVSIVAELAEQALPGLHDALTADPNVASPTLMRYLDGELVLTVADNADEAKLRAAVGAFDVAGAIADTEARVSREAAVRQRTRDAITNLEAGTDAIDADNLFASATAAEKAYLQLLGRAAASLARLELRELDE